MKIPVTNSISWLGLVVSLLPLSLMLAINAWLAPRWCPFVGMGVWMASVVFLRRWLTGAHRKGIRLVKIGRFEEAIPMFAEAYASMCCRPWIDKFRWPLLGSCSRWSYREMALCNLAFCHGQAGNGQKMKECYQKALAEFPGSILATVSLRMIEAAAQKETTAPASTVTS